MTECLTIKPHFCWQVYLWDDLFRISFLSVWSTLFLAAGYSNANDIDWWPTPFLLFAMICVPAVFLAAWQFGVMTYQNIEYRITQDRIEIGASEPPRNVEASRYTDHSDRVEPVGILNDLGLQRPSSHVRGKAVRLDRVSDGLDCRRLPAAFSENCSSSFGGKP